MRDDAIRLWDIHLDMLDGAVAGKDDPARPWVLVAICVSCLRRGCCSFERSLKVGFAQFCALA